MGCNQQKIQLFREIRKLLEEEVLSQQDSEQRLQSLKNKLTQLESYFSVGIIKIMNNAESLNNNIFLSREKHQTGDSDEWITITKASELAEVHKGTIGKNADAGKIKDNGKRFHKRRVKKSSVLCWIGKRRVENRKKAFRDYERRLDQIQ